MSYQNSKTLIRRYYEDMWNRWDFSLASDLIDEFIVFRGSLGIDVHGREGFTEYMHEVRRAFPDFHNQIEELLAEHDKVAARLTYTGTHQGELFGFPATGQHITYYGAAIFRISGNRVAEGWVLGDVHNLVHQLSAGELERSKTHATQAGEKPCVVSVRPTARMDLDFVLEAENHPDTTPFILPWTRAQHANALTDSDLAHQIILGPDGQRVGFLLLAGLTNPHGSIEFRRIVITAKGAGFGRAAIQHVKRFAFSERRAHRLWLDVKAQNRRARRLYESEGFVIEGVLHECLRSPSGFDSLVVMAMLASQYSEQHSINSSL